MDFQISSKLTTDSLWAESKNFTPHKISIWDLKTIFERKRAENDEIPKSSFPFQPQIKNGKKVKCINLIIIDYKSDMIYCAERLVSLEI